MPAAPSCVNITNEGERRRRLSGWAALLAGAIVAGGLAYRGASSMTYFAVFPFAFGAAFALLEARQKTCVILGFKGAAEVEGGGLRRVGEPERTEARREATRILWRSLVIALGVTLALVIASGLRFSAE